MADGALTQAIPAAAAAPDPVDLAVGARIRLRRHDLRVSQSALAEALGVSFQQVQKYERGANRISASMIVRVARRLDAPVAWFFGEAEGAPQVNSDMTALAMGPTGQTLLRAAMGLPPDRLRALARVAQALAPRDGEG